MEVTMARTNTSLGGNERDHIGRSLSGCLRLLRTARYNHVPLVEQDCGYRKLASQSREHDERPVLRLELRHKEELDPKREKHRGKWHPL